MTIGKGFWRTAENLFALKDIPMQEGKKLDRKKEKKTEKMSNFYELDVPSVGLKLKVRSPAWIHSIF